MAKTSTRNPSARAAERRRDRSRRQRTTGIVAALVGMALVGGVVLLVVLDANKEGPGELLPSLGNQHITPPETYDNYNSTPPTSGPHYGNLAEWGVHDVPIPNELQIHNLEDGGVVIQYDCLNGCPELVAQLEEIVQRYPDRVLLAPYPDMEHTIALTAWTRIDAFDEFDQQRIVTFINAYRGIDHHARF